MVKKKCILTLFQELKVTIPEQIHHKHLLTAVALWQTSTEPNAKSVKHPMEATLFFIGCSRRKKDLCETCVAYENGDKKKRRN